MNDILRDYQNYLYELDKSEKTIQAYMTDLRSFLGKSKTEESLVLENITPLDVIDYRNNMLAQGRKPSTINRHLTSISSFCQWAHKKGYILNNPVEGIRPVAEEPLGPAALEQKQQLALIKAVRESGNIRDLAIITMLLHTGLRVNELCNLQMFDIVLSKNSNTITVREGKGTKRRTIPLNSTAVGILKDYLKSPNRNRITGTPIAQSQFLFYGQKRTPLTNRGVHYIVTKHARLAQIEHISPHSLRHTCAKNLIDAGQSIDRVAKILGHSSVNTTTIYTVPTERDLQKTMDSIAW